MVAEIGFEPHDLRVMSISFAMVSGSDQEISAF